MKLPTITELYPLIRAVKQDISDEYRAYEDDEMPGIQLTIGWNESGDWSFQTGDNSYSGGAYSYPHWAVIGVYRFTNCRDAAKDAIEQLAELASY